MTDMLIKLYDLPEILTINQRLEKDGFTIRRAMAYERGVIVKWVQSAFGSQWAQECRAAFGKHPLGCFISLSEGGICGFCCIDCTFLGFLGPIGVNHDQQNRGVGRGLLLNALEAMRWQGYAYAVVGQVAHPDFFKKCTGAVAIEGSTPGAYPERPLPA